MKKYTRADFIGELSTESRMRRNVWGNVKDRLTGRPVFSTTSHQDRYDTLAAMLIFMEEMTDKEFETVAAAIKRRREQKAASNPTLF